MEDNDLVFFQLEFDVGSPRVFSVLEDFVYKMRPVTVLIDDDPKDLLILCTVFPDIIFTNSIV